jgi:hypothetical protein
MAVLVLLALRLPFLPATLEDIDSVNFDLGVHDYDPVHHQPHPPGYPVYIFLARLIHPWGGSHAEGLALLSAIFGALAIVPLYGLMRRLMPWREASLACVLTLFNPIVWFNSVRPMSDVTAFFFIASAQWAMLTAFNESSSATTRRRWWLAGAVLAAISIGCRVQAVWLVGPLLLYGTWRWQSLQMAGATALSFVCAVALWAEPTIVLSGGAEPYFDAFTSMVRSSAPAESLALAPSLRRTAAAVIDVLVSPWRMAFGIAVVGMAGVGVIVLARTDRRLLGLLSVLFVPYAAYHFALQSTPTLRYAIPIVPLTASLASAALVRFAPRRIPFPALPVAVVTVSGVLVLPALASYHATPSPPFQALAAIEEIDARRGSVAVSGYRVFERYLAQVRRHEVLMPTEGARQTLMEHWRRHAEQPVLFLREPMRRMLLLFGDDRPQRLGRWRWPAPVRPFMNGERPGRVELVRLEAPRWFAESGLLVAAEAGPPGVVANEQPRLQVRSPREPSVLVVSGRLDDVDVADIALKFPDENRSTWRVGKQFVLRTMLEPAVDRRDYVRLSLEPSAKTTFTDVWVQPGRAPFIRPSHGFYLAERDEDAELFRWIAPRAVAVAYLPAPRGRLTITGWIPVAYYRMPLLLTLEWNGRPAGIFTVNAPRFRIERDVVGLPDQPWSELAVTASQSFVPHDRQHNGDRRTLAVKIYGLAFEPRP